VLRLWRDHVRIALCPDRVIAVHCKAGLRPRIVAKKVHKYSGSESDWQAAIPALQTVLDNPDWQNADATLIISNHFVRYLQLPWNDVALTNAEKNSLLQERFAEVYGEASATWELRLNEGSFGSPSLASGMDQGLLEQVKSTFNVSPLQLKSIQPYLMTAFNVCRRELSGGAAWFVLAEQGIFCIGLLQNGQWQSIRLRRTTSNYLTGSDWFDEVMLVLEREMLRADNGNDTSKVFVYAPENSALSKIKHGAFDIHPLLPNSRAILSQQEMNSYAMAAAGI
jgi:hypothetical protein